MVFKWRSGIYRWLLCLLLTFQSLMAVGGGAAGGAGPSLEQLTLVYLYNFLKFTEWPQGDALNELTLCVSENAKFGAELGDLAVRTAQNKNVRILRIALGADTRICQLLFIDRAEHVLGIREWLRGTANRPILLVSDLPGFLDIGGMIMLTEENNRLQFEVNLDNVKSTGLKLNSQLLKLAREVRGR